MDLSFFNLDIEPTNRCNAKCYFCPRDQTPHQGLMTPETFAQTLERTIEFRSVASERFGLDVRVNLCGLGEPLLNRHTPDFVRQLRDAGFHTSISTNGALLTDERADALLAAGLQGAEINVGEEGEAYDDIYKLPFEKTLANVERFAEKAGDDCAVRIVLVDHRRDPEHLEHMRGFWRERGIDQFLAFEIMNRGGALQVDHMQYESFPEIHQAREVIGTGESAPYCVVPFIFLFVGYDGQYYLCCSDWKKEAPLGSVFDLSFLDVTSDKLARVVSREPVCKTCNFDPLNRLTEALRAEAAGEDVDSSAIAAELLAADGKVRDLVDRLGGRLPAGALDGRKLIPIASL